MTPIVDEPKEVIISKSCIATDDARKLKVLANSNKQVFIDDAIVKVDKSASVHIGSPKSKEKDKVVKPLAQNPRPLPLFLQKINKKVEDDKFHKFISMLKQLLVIIPLAEALEQMLGYGMFVKDLASKKKIVRFKLVDNIHYYGAITLCMLVQKKEDPSAFTIPSPLEHLNVLRHFVNLVKASI